MRYESEVRIDADSCSASLTAAVAEEAAMTMLPSANLGEFLSCPECASLRIARFMRLDPSDPSSAVNLALTLKRA